MQSVSATEANRHFSNVLKQVSQGEEFLVISRGKPVATITPVKKADRPQQSARKMLLQRLHTQEATGFRSWSRDELYERTP